MSDKLHYVGTRNGIIMLVNLDAGCEDFMLVKLRTDWWSEGWDYYPIGLHEKALKKIRPILGSKAQDTKK